MNSHGKKNYSHLLKSAEESSAMWGHLLQVHEISGLIHDLPHLVY
jgi:hypothetical protein